MYKSKPIKYSNRDRILECIYRNPRISRKEISGLTAITPATVTTTTAALLQEGLIRELGEIQEGRKSIGRNRIALDIQGTYGYVIGAEFTTTALTVCATDLHGRILRTYRLPHTPRVYDDITNLLIRYIHRCIQDVGSSQGRLLGIGVAVPGHTDQQTGAFISSNPHWGNFSTHAIQKAFPCPVAFENNVRCMAVAEYLHHPESTPSSFALYHIGRGMFCANVADDELYIGTTYGSGEIAHTIAVPGGRRCECGKRGCLQTIATESAILENAGILLQRDPNSLLKSLVKSPDELAIEQVVTAYELGDPAVCRLLSQALQYICISALNIAVLTNPEKLLIHGILFNNSQIRQDFMEMVRDQFDFAQNNYNLGTVDFLTSSPTDGAVGAASLAILHCVIHA